MSPWRKPINVNPDYNEDPIQFDYSTSEREKRQQEEQESVGYG